MYHKMVILFYTLSILPSAAVLENCLETLGLKPLKERSKTPSDQAFEGVKFITILLI